MADSSTLPVPRAASFQVPAPAQEKTTRPNWKDDQIEQLRLLVEEGLSARAIADRLKLTRNAVISKCYRLGFVLANIPTGGRGAPKRKGISKGEGYRCAGKKTFPTSSIAISPSTPAAIIIPMNAARPAQPIAKPAAKPVIERVRETPTAPAPQAVISQPPAHNALRTWSKTELDVLRDLVVRQGCTLTTAARIMSTMTKTAVTAEHVVELCQRHGITAQAAPTNLKAAQVTTPAAPVVPKERIIPVDIARAQTETPVFAAPASAPIIVSKALVPTPVVAKPVLVPQDRPVEKIFEELPFQAPAAAEKPSAPAIATTTKGVPLLKLRDCHCRYITGRGSDGLAMYCGEQRTGARSYCKDHYKVMFMPPPEKKAKARRPADVRTAPKANRYREYLA